MAAFGGEIERRRSRKVACVDRRAALQQKVDQFETAGSGGVAERPRAQSVPRVYGRASIKQSRGEVDAIGICGGEQRQRHLDRGELGLSRLILAVELAAPCWIRRGRSDLRCANDEQRGQSNATIQDALLRHGVVIASPFRSASHDPPLLPSRARRDDARLPVRTT
jgi:hypothetical protein